MDRKKFDELMAQSEKKIAEIQSKIESQHTKMEETFANAIGGVDAPERAPGMQFGFDVVEVQRVGLTPGDVLMVTVKNDDLSQQLVDALCAQLQQVFPSNKVFVFAMGTSDAVELSIVSQSEIPLANCSTGAYCGDCDCGKKERAQETEDEHMKNLAKQAGESNG